MSRMPTVSLEGKTWIVRLGGDGAKTQEYHCATEAQAVKLMKVFGREATRGAANAPASAGGDFALVG